MILRNRKYLLSLMVLMISLLLNGCDVFGNVSSTTTATTEISTVQTGVTTESIDTTDSSNTGETTTTIDTSTTSVITTASTATETQTSTEEAYLITFNSEEGSQVEPIYYTVSSSFLLPEPEREYYLFLGWYLNSDFSGEPVSEIIPGMTGDMIFFAKWEEDMSSIVLDFFGDFLVIPNHCLLIDGEDITILPEHLDDLMDALNHLGFYDVNTIEFNFDLETLGSYIIEYGIESDILHATISKLLIGTEDRFSFPYYSLNGDVIRYVDSVDMIEYIAVDEIVKLFNALNALEVNDYHQAFYFPLMIDLYLDYDFENLFSSAFIHYAFSQALISLQKDNVILIPYYDADVNPLIITYGENETLSEYIVLSEIELFIEAMKTLGVTSIDTFSGDIDLASLTNEELNEILSSTIMYITISQRIFDSGILGDSVPDSVILTYSSGDEEINVIVKEEILLLARACVISDFHMFDYVDFHIDQMMNLSTLDQQEVLLSVIVRNSLTSQLEDIAITIGFTLTSENYDMLSTDNALNANTIIEMLEAYAEFYQ